MCRTPSPDAPRIVITYGDVAERQHRASKVEFTLCDCRKLNLLGRYPALPGPFEVRDGEYNDVARSIRQTLLDFAISSTDS